MNNLHLKKQYHINNGMYLEYIGTIDFHHLESQHYKISVNSLEKLSMQLPTLINDSANDDNCPGRTIKCSKCVIQNLAKDPSVAIPVICKTRMFPYGLNDLVKCKIDELLHAAARIKIWGVFLREYTYKLGHVKGKHNEIADCLSRLPGNMETEKINIKYVHMISNPPYLNMNEINKARKTNELLKKIIKYILTRWPSKEQLSLKEMKFYHIRNQLWTENNRLMRGENLIVLPEILYEKCISLAHSYHMGKTKTKRYLRKYFWLTERFNKTVQERLRIKYKQGVDPALVLNQFTMLYRSNKQSTTEMAPSKLLHGRTMKTRLNKELTELPFDQLDVDMIAKENVKIWQNYTKNRDKTRNKSLRKDN
ncbi:hypothetical protein A3Q56_04085 [Intoshia linei]|uniref:Integrase zinc-binding domain-containing protein n=1 Tax=Intoshia linei TaxID=1819745 RepID=A0A177B429_9BILA|nr:hypothetical protein A3Q56_04085 [Intoshia linei]